MLTAAHEALENNGKIAEGLLMNCLWSVQFRSRRIIHIWIQLRTRTSRKKKMKRYVMGFFEKSRTKMRFSLPLNCNNHLWKLEDGNTLTSRVGREQRGHDSIIAGFFLLQPLQLIVTRFRFVLLAVVCGYFITLVDIKAAKWPFYMHDMSSPLLFIIRPSLMFI